LEQRLARLLANFPFFDQQDFATNGATEKKAGMPVGMDFQGNELPTEGTKTLVLEFFLYCLMIRESQRLLLL